VTRASRRIRSAVWAILSILVVSRSGTAAAQSSPRWEFSVTPYAWWPSQKGQIGIGDNLTEVDLTFGDLADQISLGLMGVFEARYERWLGRFDGMYRSLTDDEAAALASGTPATVRVNLDQVMVNPEVGYTLLAAPWGGIDGLVGARYWHVSTDIGASSGSTPAGTVSDDHHWVDGTVAGRVRYEPGPKWHVFALGDVGAGGSDFTWQAMAGAAYAFTDCCSAVVSYRHLDVDYKSDSFTNDSYMTGPALGLMIGFGGGSSEEP
jgi:opacity protein-like surface antigen